ncbi:MAG: hypothetical protein RSB18_02585, partial [Clostridia bacterium]
VPACSVSAYNPSAQNNLRRLVKKCFDSLHFVHCLQRATQYHYVCVLEYALDDAVTRAGLRDELVRKINCVMSSRIGSTHKFVDAIEVVNIEEWNAAHTEFPIRQVPLAASSESADFS